MFQNLYRCLVLARQANIKTTNIDKMGTTKEELKTMNKKSSIEILERIYQSLSNGMRNAKADVPRLWLRDKYISFESTHAAFNSGQIHHRKPQDFLDELVSVGFLKISNAATNTGKPGYTCFGNFSIIFPLRNENNHIVNFFETGIRKSKNSYMNEEGIYPAYPHAQTKKLIIVDTILEAATILHSEILDNKEAVIALHNGELKQQHQNAIASLKELTEVIYLQSKK